MNVRSLIVAVPLGVAGWALFAFGWGAVLGEWQTALLWLALAIGLTTLTVAQIHTHATADTERDHLRATLRILADRETVQAVRDNLDAILVADAATTHELRALLDPHAKHALRED